MEGRGRVEGVKCPYHMSYGFPYSGNDFLHRFLAPSATADQLWSCVHVATRRRPAGMHYTLTHTCTWEERSERSEDEGVLFT